MKAFLKIVYGFAIITMFGIFGWFLMVRFDQYYQGYYETPSVDKAQCESINGLVLIVNGEERCYTDTENYLTGDELTPTVVSNFSECETAGGEIISIPLNRRCYMSETEFFNEKTEDEIVNSISTFEECETIGGEIYENRCYLDENYYFEK